MDDALVVRGGQAPGNLARVVQCLAFGQRRLSDSLAKGLAVEQLRDHVR